jgi:peptide deformylase
LTYDKVYFWRTATNRFFVNPTIVSTFAPKPPKGRQKQIKTSSMSQISIESLEKALTRIDGLSEDALDKKIEELTLNQENLLNYILQAGLEYENDDLNMYSIYYFAVALEAFNEEGLKLKEISEDDIDNFQEPFLLALDAIYEQEDYTPMQDLIEQHHIAQFMMAEIEAVDEDGEELDEETKTQLFIVSSGMIGLLNAAVIR